MPDEREKHFFSSGSPLAAACGGRTAAPTVVQGDDVQAVEQLSFVLVDPLHLHVKHGAGVDLHLVVLLKMCSELHLVLLKVQAEECEKRATDRKHFYLSKLSLV